MIFNQIDYRSSALKHNISIYNIRHAIDNALWLHELNDGLLMFIGPDHAGNLIEVGVVRTDEEDTPPVVVHAMPARPKFFRR